jgi:acyl-CoA thioesterase FadM
MNLYFRLLLQLVRAVLWKRERMIPFGEGCKTPMLVFPNDLDLNLHMNNGRYPALMDLARFDLMAQTGIFFPCFKRKWMPILGATQMIFRRPLNLFQPFYIETQMEYWDDKWFILKQTFVSKGKVVAVGRVRALMRGPEGNVAPAKILELAAVASPLEPPTLTPELGQWIDSLDALRIA